MSKCLCTVVHERTYRTNQEVAGNYSKALINTIKSFYFFYMHSEVYINGIIYILRVYKFYLFEPNFSPCYIYVKK